MPSAAPSCTSELSRMSLGNVGSSTTVLSQPIVWHTLDCIAPAIPVQERKPPDKCMGTSDSNACTLSANPVQNASHSLVLSFLSMTGAFRKRCLAIELCSLLVVPSALPPLSSTKSNIPPGFLERFVLLQATLGHVITRVQLQIKSEWWGTNVPNFFH